jgi:hypothetical protein
MKQKRLIERNLKFTNRYTYISLKRGSIEDGEATICDNCGKLITNIVHVIQNDTKKHYYIGTDCSDTLSEAKCLYNNGTQSDYQIDMYSYNKTARFVTELNKGKKMDNNGIMCYIQTDKGKTIDCYTNDLKKWFPQYL